jgi:hypothetical protein
MGELASSKPMGSIVARFAWGVQPNRVVHRNLTGVRQLLQPPSEWFKERDETWGVVHGTGEWLAEIAKQADSPSTH